MKMIWNGKNEEFVVGVFPMEYQKLLYRTSLAFSEEASNKLPGHVSHLAYY